MNLTFKVEPGGALNLADYDPRYKADLDRKDAEEQFQHLAREIDELQELLYAASTHSLLVVLQGMDTSGKDGTIRKVFHRVDPLGTRVKSFKTPTEEELAHDFLWRVHQNAPCRGEIGIFNRSHYEDVLIVRVHNLVPESIWRQRYRQINDFERLLTENNTIVLKFFLHISYEEQAERLREREEEVAKAWKLSVGDWEERQLWDAYQAAYVDALRLCSTECAPWHIVPADRKWFRNLAIATTIVEMLRPLKADWLAQLKRQSDRSLAELREYRERNHTAE